MSIENFLNQHIDDVRQIVSGLDGDFSSHHFIQKFARRFEGDYIDFLQTYRKPAGEQGAFQTVHQQIARFLSKNAELLHIEKTNRRYTQNVFGDETDNQGWKKVQHN
jgi:hypothetical protein